MGKKDTKIFFESSHILGTYAFFLVIYDYSFIFFDSIIMHKGIFCQNVASIFLFLTHFFSLVEKVIAAFSPPRRALGSSDRGKKYVWEFI